MTEEFNLKDKLICTKHSHIHSGICNWVYKEEDVKEFINILLQADKEKLNVTEVIKNYAGEKLVDEDHSKPSLAELRGI